MRGERSSSSAISLVDRLISMKAQMRFSDFVRSGWRVERRSRNLLLVISNCAENISHIFFLPAISCSFDNIYSCEALSSWSFDSRFFITSNADSICAILRSKEVCFRLISSSRCLLRFWFSSDVRLCMRELLTAFRCILRRPRKRIIVKSNRVEVEAIIRMTMHKAIIQPFMLLAAAFARSASRFVCK